MNSLSLILFFISDCLVMIDCHNIKCSMRFCGEPCLGTMFNSAVSTKTYFFHMPFCRDALNHCGTCVWSRESLTLNYTFDNAMEIH